MATTPTETWEVVARDSKTVGHHKEKGGKRDLYIEDQGGGGKNRVVDFFAGGGRSYSQR